MSSAHLLLLSYACAKGHLRMVYQDHGITSLPLPNTHITHLTPTTPLINGLAQLLRFPKPIKQRSPLYLPVDGGVAWQTPWLIWKGATYPKHSEPCGYSESHTFHTVAFYPQCFSSVRTPRRPHACTTAFLWPPVKARKEEGPQGVTAWGMGLAAVFWIAFPSSRILWSRSPSHSHS